MIREVLVEPQGLAWLPWAVSYFSFIGIAYAAILVAFLMHFFSKSRNIKFELIAVTIALAFVIVGPIALLADLHQPARAYRFYFSMAPWSWMAWGSFFLPLFAVSVVGYFFFLVREIANPNSFPKWLKLLLKGNLNNSLFTKIFSISSLITAGLIVLYTFMEVYVVKARPLWHEPALLPLFLLSIYPAAALLIDFTISTIFKTATPKWLTTTSLVSALLLVVTLFWYTQTSAQNAEDILTLWHNSATLIPTVLSLSVLIIMLLIPRQSLLWKGIATLLAIIVGILIRWVVLIDVQMIPKYTALLNYYELSWSTNGGLGMISMLGLLLFVSVILWQLLTYVLQSKVEGHHYG